jgi:LysR family glycine cleavage system transcriptional activator
MRRLPPFAPLVAFEAVARLGSFTLAARELGLTQSAVSHRIRQLEQHFGARLIERQPVLGLTPRGERLLPELTAALNSLAGLEAHRAGRSRSRPFRVGAGSALVTHWLARRLPRLSAVHPSLVLELIPFENWDDAMGREVDLRILWVTEGATPPHGIGQRPLGRERVFPVCSPQLLPPGCSPADEAALHKLPLIDKKPKGRSDSPSLVGSEWKWASWVPEPVPPPALRVGDINAALCLAAEGAGAALGRSLLVADALASGRLARVLSPEKARPCGKLQVLRWPTALEGDGRVQALAEWLVGEAACSLAQAHRDHGATPEQRTLMTGIQH